LLFKILWQGGYNREENLLFTFHHQTKLAAGGYQVNEQITEDNVYSTSKKEHQYYACAILCYLAEERQIVW